MRSSFLERSHAKANATRVILFLACLPLLANSRESQATKQVKHALDHFRRATYLQEKGKLDAAIAEYREALRLEPDEAYWHRALGEALEKKGDHQGAVEEYRLASKYSPHDSGLSSRYEELLAGTEVGEAGRSRPGQVSPGRMNAWTVGGEVTPPVPTYKAEPPYSQRARDAKYMGTVLLAIVIDAQGNVTDTKVVKPIGLGLDQQAVEQIRAWKFKPATRHGVPVPVRVMVEVTFRLF